MYKLVLVRHGESLWNKKGLFTGWTDVNLSSQGKLESRAAGKQLRKKNFVFDLAYTSFLKRASLTLEIILKELKESKIPIDVDWRLNERHYGNLQGLNKVALVKKLGEKQVLLWRRSYSIRPPKISKKNLYNQEQDSRYKNIIVPKTESLKDVVQRVVPFWKEKIIPQLKNKQRIIIVSSGNTLRALTKYLDKMSVSEVFQLNIPTGIPLVYEFDKDLKVKGHYYLATSQNLEKALNRVKKQINI